jgi:ribosomal protein S27AE
MSDENEFGIDVERETIRGHCCPRCGGKIIPSNRAVYQSAGDPAAVYPLWECERCGYSEMSEKPKVEKGKHGK